MQSAVPVILQQHAEDTAVLYATRMQLAAASHAKLHHLRRFDERIAAHLDGLRVAGDSARPICEAALEQPSPGAMFAAAVGAIESKRQDRLDRLIALAQAVPEMAPGLRAAFAWVEPQQLRGSVAELLASDDPQRRLLGLAASGMHRADPMLEAARRLDDVDPLARARAHRTAGELGKREFLSRLGVASNDADPVSAFWAAWSAVLLGDRHNAQRYLTTVAQQPGAFRARALPLTLLAASLQSAHEFLRSLAQQPTEVRWLIQGVGLVGDPSYIPWLLNHMADDRLARLAGDAFALVTGADLGWLDLDRKPPEALVAGPNDDPNDADVAMDEDDGLPWPDVERIQRWWTQNSARFTPGQRYFVGAPVTREHCIEVLRTGYQRQRMLAAHHLCLLDPGSVLFEWRAPAWRQVQALAALA